MQQLMRKHKKKNLKSYTTNLFLREKRINKFILVYSLFLYTKGEIMGTKKLLGKPIIEVYNFTKVKRRVTELFSILEYLSIANEELPSITTSYTVRYNQFKPTKNSKIENFVVNKLMKEIKEDEKRIILLSKITIALRKLTKEELQVFNMMFYENRKDDYILSNMPFCEDIIYTIKKSACIKFVVALGIDYDLHK